MPMHTSTLKFKGMRMYAVRTIKNENSRSRDLNLSIIL